MGRKRVEKEKFDRFTAELFPLDKKKGFFCDISFFSNTFFKKVDSFFAFFILFM